MAGFVRGEVVVVPYPYSDLSGLKNRPALVIGTPPGSDLIRCQITSQVDKGQLAVPLEERDFSSGRLSKPSLILPAKLFTMNIKLIQYRAGVVKGGKLDEVADKVMEIISGSPEHS